MKGKQIIILSLMIISNILDFPSVIYHCSLTVNCGKNLILPLNCIFIRVLKLIFLPVELEVKVTIKVNAEFKVISYLGQSVLLSY